MAITATDTSPSIAAIPPRTAAMQRALMWAMLAAAHDYTRIAAPTSGPRM
jgi:hypothetical protein